MAFLLKHEDMTIETIKTFTQSNQLVFSGDDESQALSALIDKLLTLVDHDKVLEFIGTLKSFKPNHSTIYKDALIALNQNISIEQIEAKIAQFKPADGFNLNLVETLKAYLQHTGRTHFFISDADILDLNTNHNVSPLNICHLDTAIESKQTAQSLMIEVFKKMNNDRLLLIQYLNSPVFNVSDKGFIESIINHIKENEKLGGDDELLDLLKNTHFSNQEKSKILQHSNSRQPWTASQILDAAKLNMSYAEINGLSISLDPKTIPDSPKSQFTPHDILKYKKHKNKKADRDLVAADDPSRTLKPTDVPRHLEYASMTDRVATSLATGYDLEVIDHLKDVNNISFQKIQELPAKGVNNAELLALKNLSETNDIKLDIFTYRSLVNKGFPTNWFTTLSKSSGYAATIFETFNENTNLIPNVNNQAFFQALEQKSHDFSANQIQKVLKLNLSIANIQKINNKQLHQYFLGKNLDLSQDDKDKYFIDDSLKKDQVEVIADAGYSYDEVALLQTLNINFDDFVKLSKSKFRKPTDIQKLNTARGTQHSFDEVLQIGTVKFNINLVELFYKEFKFTIEQIKQLNTIPLEGDKIKDYLVKYISDIEEAHRSFNHFMSWMLQEAGKLKTASEKDIRYLYKNSQKDTNESLTDGENDLKKMLDHDDGNHDHKMKSLEDSFKLLTSRFSGPEIVALSDTLKFSFKEILALNNSKLSKDDIEKIYNDSTINKNKQLVLQLASTGFTLTELTYLINKSIPISIIYLAGTNNYTYDQLINLINIPTVFSLLTNANTKGEDTLNALFKQNTYEQLFFLSAQSKLNADNISDLSKHPLTAKSLSLWHRAYGIIQEAIEDLEEEYFNTPHEDDSLKQSIDDCEGDYGKLDVIINKLITILQVGGPDQEEDIKIENAKISSIIKEYGAGGKSAAASAKGRARDRAGQNVKLADPGDIMLSEQTTDLYKRIKVGSKGNDKESSAEVFHPIDTRYEPAKGVLNLPKTGETRTNVPIGEKHKGNDSMKQRIRMEISHLPKPINPAKNLNVEYKEPARKKDRGDGQFKSMANYNAATYAFALNLLENVYPTGTTIENTDWEWLHLRAASLGGDTNSQNLLPGLHDANTLMIPIENNLKELAMLANNKRRLIVDYDKEKEISGSDGHAFQFIVLKWKFGENSTNDDLQTGEAVFDIINSRVVTKGDIAILEQFLKEKKDEMKISQ